MERPGNDPTDDDVAPAPGAAAAAVRLGPNARAALWMAGALASFSTMAVCGRELAGRVPTFEILFWRSLIGVLVIVALLARSGWAQARPRRLGQHLLR
ncbi:MAG TPA: hypothetical protein VLL72_06535, partial [Kiloniellales bacterium]|nr:hypothetical protein [Kiloniellales bacterium]